MSEEELHAVAHFNADLSGWVCNCGAGGIPFGDRYTNREMRNHLRYSHTIEGAIVSLGARDTFMYAQQPVPIPRKGGNECLVK